MMRIGRGEDRDTSPMTTPKQFRQFAIECGRHALDTTDERHREILLGVAELWMDAAIEVERSLVRIDDEELVVAQNHRR
jgi:hypothetical protein